MFAKSPRRLRAFALGALLAGTAGAADMLQSPAVAQPTQSLDRPGIDHYPSWMHESDPYIPGRDQDYRIWEDDRFDRLDPDFLAWRRDQRRRYGPDWRSRPGYQSDLREWLDNRQ